MTVTVSTGGYRRGVYRFLLERRWLGFHLLTIVLCVACVAAGLWQLDRREQRSAMNTVIETNADRDPVEVSMLLSPDDTPADAQTAVKHTWRRVTATGSYDTAAQVLVRNRTYPGRGVGYEVLTPLVTAEGTALVVNRGWVRAAATARTVPQVPAPPAGEVTVTGRVRPSQVTPQRADPPAGQLLAVDLDRVAGSLPYAVFGGYVDLVAQRPVPAEAPLLLPAPQVKSGPHLAYSVQWFLFAAIGVLGWVVLVRREASERQVAAADGAVQAHAGPSSPADRSPPIPASRVADVT